MVSVEEVLKVSADEFFEQIENSIAYDASEATGKEIRPEDLCQGFSYSKEMKNKLGGKGEVTIVIKQFTKPQIYEAEFTSMNGTNSITYEIFDMGPEIKVKYSEDYYSEKKLNDLNSKLTTFFYQRKAKKNAIRMLKTIEAYILNHKKYPSQEP